MSSATSRAEVLSASPRRLNEVMAEVLAICECAPTDPDEMPVRCWLHHPTKYSTDLNLARDAANELLKQKRIRWWVIESDDRTNDVWPCVRVNGPDGASHEVNSPAGHEAEALVRALLLALVPMGEER